MNTPPDFKNLDSPDEWTQAFPPYVSNRALTQFVCQVSKYVYEVAARLRQGSISLSR